MGFQWPPQQLEQQQQPLPEEPRQDDTGLILDDYNSDLSLVLDSDGWVKLNIFSFLTTYCRYAKSQNTSVLSARLNLCLSVNICYFLFSIKWNITLAISPVRPNV